MYFSISSVVILEAKKSVLTSMLLDKNYLPNFNSFNISYCNACITHYYVSVCTYPKAPSTAIQGSRNIPRATNSMTPPAENHICAPAHLAIMSGVMSVMSCSSPPTSTVGISSSSSSSSSITWISSS